MEHLPTLYEIFLIDIIDCLFSMLFQTLVFYISYVLTIESVVPIQ